LQKRRHLDLTNEQRLAPFTVWGEHDKARQEAEQVVARDWKFIQYHPSRLRIQISWHVGKMGNR
jgi:hypothetical protein